MLHCVKIDKFEKMTLYIVFTFLLKEGCNCALFPQKKDATLRKIAASSARVNGKNLSYWQSYESKSAKFAANLQLFDARHHHAYVNYELKIN